MHLGTGVTLTLAATDYNLFAVILKALGYNPTSLTAVPDVQVKIDGSAKFFPNQVRNYTITNAAAGTLTIKDEYKNTVKVLAASAVWEFDAEEKSTFLDKLYLSTTSAGAVPNVAVEA